MRNGNSDIARICLKLEPVEGQGLSLDDLARVGMVSRDGEGELGRLLGVGGITRAFLSRALECDLGVGLGHVADGHLVVDIERGVFAGVPLDTSVEEEVVAGLLDCGAVLHSQTHLVVGETGDLPILSAALAVTLYGADDGIQFAEAELSLGIGDVHAVQVQAVVLVLIGVVLGSDEGVGAVAVVRDGQVGQVCLETDLGTAVFRGVVQLLVVAAVFLIGLVHDGSVELLDGDIDGAVVVQTVLVVAPDMQCVARCRLFSLGEVVVVRVIGGGDGTGIFAEAVLHYLEVEALETFGLAIAIPYVSEVAGAVGVLLGGGGGSLENYLGSRLKDLLGEVACLLAPLLHAAGGLGGIYLVVAHRYDLAAGETEIGRVAVGAAVERGSAYTVGYEVLVLEVLGQLEFFGHFVIDLVGVCLACGKHSKTGRRKYYDK